MSEALERLRSGLAPHYRVERELGSGGMATVYLAHDIKHERNVALKVLHEHLSSSLGSERFLAEIKTTAKLHHPHILPLYDSGDVGGILFYVMPLVEGETLRDLMDRERRMDIDNALRLFHEIADALGFAHAQGIVHRDLKPENVMLASGHAFVADFGIARAVSSASASGARLTQAGLTLGTAAYMSPEQAAGDENLDSRSDIYSLACVLWEMLAAEPPFKGPTQQSIIAQRFILELGPSVADVRASVPPLIDAAIRKAMAREPVDRFQTAVQFAEALKEAVKPLPRPSTPEASTSTPAGRPSRESMATPARSSLTVKLMGVGHVKRPTTAAMDFNTSELLVRGRSIVGRRAEGIQKGIEFLEQAVARSPDSALALAELATAYSVAAVASTVAPGPAWAKVSELARQALAIDPNVARVHVELGNVAFWNDRDWITARAHFDRAVALGPGDPWVQSSLANYWSSLGHHDDALWRYERAVSIDSRNPSVRIAMVIGQFLARRFEATVASCNEIIALDPSYSEAQRWKGLALRQLGDFNAALAACDAAVRQSTAHAWAVASLAMVQAVAGREDKAKAGAQELIMRFASKPVSPVAIALVFAHLDETDEAFRWLEVASESRDPWLVMMRTDACFDPVRYDPRFGDLIEIVGIPEWT